jgi:hypothetical protein
MFTTVESSTTMSWASPTATSVHQRREDGAGTAGAAESGSDVVCDMEETIYETR